MEAKDLTFPGGLILGACLALGVAAFAVGARLLRRRGRDASTPTALDIDMPNYAWLR